MGQVRWASWTVAIAAALATVGSQAVAQELRGIASDKPAAIVLYPKVAVDTDVGVDTIIRMANTNPSSPTDVHCFYLNANSHCSGGSNHGAICTNDPGKCSGGGVCVPGWVETDFRIRLTAEQPIEWLASYGLADSRRCEGALHAEQHGYPDSAGAGRPVHRRAQVYRHRP
jgi:hypothetical protein